MQMAVRVPSLYPLHLKLSTNLKGLDIWFIICAYNWVNIYQDSPMSLVLTRNWIFVKIVLAYKTQFVKTVPIFKVLFISTVLINNFVLFFNILLIGKKCISNPEMLYVYTLILRKVSAADSHFNNWVVKLNTLCHTWGLANWLSPL